MINTIYPLAESSYYVFPPAVVSEIFKCNSLTQAQEIHNVNPQKLQQIFGADAVLYINVEEYGVNYQIFDSVTKVKVRGKLVDLRNRKTLWEGAAYADDSNRYNNNGTMMNFIPTIIIGAGAAGLFCAAQLGKLGQQVSVFDNGKKIDLLPHHSIIEEIKQGKSNS